ncbi:cytochrome ubiquinol oxidase subunit II [uncultured Sphingomonas sp.]|uniref:cytochrome ubiquinol oxidase subunit II n=1 Tax=uncultured Sphingomonas sp. TaxID=158754 RepID=UPI0025DADBBE|nr:cytochrome ubiquinol oxidase subunit II [uncultured Sphingomonas sp.]
MNASSILHPAGPIAAANREILINALAVMLSIVIPTILLAIATAWWFRAGNRRARRDEAFVYSGRIELVVWSIPLLTILFLSGIIWVGSHRLDPTRPIKAPNGEPPLQVEVVSLDWRWLFIYPEQGIATVNGLVLPVGRPVRFRLTSASVMNAFFVPRLGSMVYTMNGMATELNLLASVPGRYQGLSAHYSGEGFPDMRFEAVAVPPARFSIWAARIGSREGLPLDARTYAVIACQRRDRRAFAFPAVQPGLFDAIVTQRIGPSAGPRQDRSSTDAENS